MHFVWYDFCMFPIGWTFRAGCRLVLGFWGRSSEREEELAGKQPPSHHGTMYSSAMIEVTPKVSQEADVV